MTWDIREDASAALEIEANLLVDLRKLLPQGDNASLTFAARDGKGQLVAGVSGGTSYGWLLVKVLWVTESHRRQGMATALLRHIEQQAAELGCHGAWLDSSNPAAVLWYRHRGYESFGELANGADHHPSGHQRTFLRKALTSGDKY